MEPGKKFLSDLKLYSDYLKWKDELDRYETWEEACEDIIDCHRRKFNKPELEPYLRKAEQLYKDKVVLASQRNLQYRGEQVEKHNMRMYNCTSQYICHNKSFQTAFYLALCGCGVGNGLLVPFVNNLSRIRVPAGDNVIHMVEDSIEGWADALGVLLSSYFVDEQPFPEYANKRVTFDYTLVRPKGAYISGGYKAPGPDGLRNSLDSIDTLLRKWIAAEGDRIRPILAFDILCFMADAVLSGGVRRSALNMIVDPNDDEMIMAKVGNWRAENPQRARSNNSVLLVRNVVTKEQFEKIVQLNEGDSDIGFVFGNSWFDMFNPCFEILKIPMLVKEDLRQIAYGDVEEYVRKNKHLAGVQSCNLNEINGEAIRTKEELMDAAEAAAVLGTLQAGYTSFPYLGEIAEKITAREALLGVSMTGWTNNPKLFNKEWLNEAAAHVLKINEEVARIIGTNPTARATCIKPSGNASVVLGTSSGINPDPGSRYFRVMQLNKTSATAKFLEMNAPYLLEESVWSATNSDYVVFVPVKNPTEGMYKDTIKGVKHLELIRMAQLEWVKAGTVEDRCVYPGMNHNTSCTVIVDENDREESIEYIWEHRSDFTAVSFLSDFGDKDFNQAPFTTVSSADEILEKYGDGAMLASGLIIDGLHYFNGNLWHACDILLGKASEETIFGTREQVMLRKSWLARARKFAKNYMKRDMKKTVYCLKDVHLFHKWCTISREFKPMDLGNVLPKPAFRRVSSLAAVACGGGDSCMVKSIYTEEEE